MAIKLFNILLVLYPITNIYGIGIQGFSVGKVLLLVTGFYLLLKKRLTLSFPKKYIFFAIWMFLVPYFYILSSWINPFNIVYKSIGLLVFVLLIGLSCSFTNIEYAVLYFRKSALFCTAFFYLQYFINIFTGIKILGIIPDMPLADASSIDSYVSMQSTLTRYCSVFLEPSHFAVYISMFLGVKLILLKGKFWDKEVAFVLIALILLQSGNGYLCLISICIAYLIVNGKTILQNVRNLFFFVLCISFSCIFYSSVLKSETFSETFNRMEEIDANGNQNSSGFTRIFRGFYYFSDLEWEEKVIGIGQGNEIDYAKTHSMYNFRMLATYTDAVYLNGIQQILVYGGFIGGCFFVCFLSQYYKCKKTIYLVLPFTSLFFISGVYNGSMMLLYIVFLEIILRREKFLRKNRYVRIHEK